MAILLNAAGIRAVLSKIVTDPDVTITAGFNTSPAIFVVAAGDAFVPGVLLSIKGATGLTNANGLRFVSAINVNDIPGQFTLTDLDGNNINGNGTFGGTVKATPFKSSMKPSDLEDLQTTLDRISYTRASDDPRTRGSDSMEQTIAYLFGV